MSDTTYSKLIKTILNKPLVAGVIVLFFIVVGLGKFSNAIDKELLPILNKIISIIGPLPVISKQESDAGNRRLNAIMGLLASNSPTDSERSALDEESNSLKDYIEGRGEGKDMEYRFPNKTYANIPLDAGRQISDLEPFWLSSTSNGLGHPEITSGSIIKLGWGYDYKFADKSKQPDGIGWWKGSVWYFPNLNWSKTWEPTWAIVAKMEVKLGGELLATYNNPKEYLESRLSGLPKLTGTTNGYEFFGKNSTQKEIAEGYRDEWITPHGLKPFTQAVRADPELLSVTVTYVDGSTARLTVRPD